MIYFVMDDVKIDLIWSLYKNVQYRMNVDVISLTRKTKDKFSFDFVFLVMITLINIDK